MDNSIGNFKNEHNEMFKESHLTGVSEILLASKQEHNGIKGQHHNETLSIPLHFKAMRLIVGILVKTLNIAYIPIFMYRIFEKSKKCPPVDDDVLRISATELADKIKQKQISCVEVIEKYICRIKEVNPLLNAVIAERFSQALEEARTLDQRIAMSDFFWENGTDSNGDNYPLLGVPLTVKGSIAVQGLKYSSGVVNRKEIIAENDAIAVQQARQAGAIPLLVSNVPELCMDWETSNKIIGRTKNPHDTTRSCGGSSGGEASLLAAGASLIGIGSDIAGSLRLPAHYCGVWGHKPTPGIVSYDGHYPSCTNHEQWEASFTLGPMSRYAKDLRTLLNVLIVPEKRQIARLNDKVNIEKINIFYATDLDFLFNKPTNDCLGAVRKTVDYLQNICFEQPKKVDFHLLQYAGELASINLLNINGVSYDVETEGNGAFIEILRYATMQSKHMITSIIYGILRKLVNIMPENHKENIENHLNDLRKKFEQTIGNNGVLILPTFTRKAIKHGDSLRYALDSGYMSIFNALGFPVTNCPIDVSKDGLPVGVQVVGLPYCDRLTLTVAEELERAFGGWIEPK